ncbi:MAG: polysaccharide deacetylase family protein [Clostridia bacterium]|nr:polysaccharide deacetylase family protein [Clostridia bacterium]
MARAAIGLAILAVVFGPVVLGAWLLSAVPTTGPRTAGAIDTPISYLPVLMYHHIAPPPAGRPERNHLIVRPESFRRQMACLARLGYRTPDLRQVAGFVVGRSPLPARSVVITFDDGYASFRTWAEPVLAAFGLRAVLFPIGESTPATSADPRWKRGARLPHLSWRDLAELAASGRADIGSQGWAGHRLVNGRPAYLAWGAAERREDIERFQRELASRGIPAAPAFSYPFGAVDADLARAVAEAGYDLAFTTEEGVVRPGDNPHLLRRRFVSGSYSLERFASLLVADGDRAPRCPD